MNLIELDHALKQLRLGGMAAVLETRLRQAQAEPLAPIDLISCLVSDELARRGERLLERWKKRLALRWSDVDWLNGSLRVERGIVCQKVDDVKTSESRRDLHIDGEMLNVLKLWKQTTEFSANEDWMFASPVQIGRLPWSYDQVWRVYQKAAEAAGIGRLGTHCLRHTYRSWLDAIGTPLAVQQKLMRHADISMTMKYGDVVTTQESEALAKIAQLAFANSTQRARDNA